MGDFVEEGGGGMMEVKWGILGMKEKEDWEVE